MSRDARSFEVRRLRDLSDRELLARVLALEEDAFGDAGVDLYTLPPFVVHGAVYVLFVDGELAGVAEFLRSWDARGAVLWGFAIDRRFRGQGLGKRFLAALLDDLPEGIEHVTLSVSPDNAPAVALYESLGFSRVSLVEDVFGEGGARLIMRREIARGGCAPRRDGR